MAASIFVENDGEGFKVVHHFHFESGREFNFNTKFFPCQIPTMSSHLCNSGSIPFLGSSGLYHNQRTLCKLKQDLAGHEDRLEHI